MIMVDPTPPTIYIPTFREELFSRTDLTEDYIHDQFQKRDWLTSGLIKEVEALHPTKDHTNSSNEEHDKAVFELNCNKLFCPGCIFASSRQLTQVAIFSLMLGW
jgi:hypothetical protein